MKEQMSSALKIAKPLQVHPSISNLSFPGLTNHPQAGIFNKQMSGCTGIMSFVLKSSSQDALTFMSSLKVFFFCFVIVTKLYGKYFK
jgi:cystathionine beta-lyase/cystathionine gamma-synthase